MITHTIEELWSRVFHKWMWEGVITDNSCMIWPGAKLPSGYGRYGYRVNGKRISGYVHRLSYIFHKGPIPEGMEIDHICSRRDCINSDHLEAVTHRENMRRGNGFAGKQARQTHCKYGHEFSVSNTYISKDGERDCRQCNAISQRKRRERCQRLAQN